VKTILPTWDEFACYRGVAWGFNLQFKADTEVLPIPAYEIELILEDSDGVEVLRKAGTLTDGGAGGIANITLDETDTDLDPGAYSGRIEIRPPVSGLSIIRGRFTIA